MEKEMAAHSSILAWKISWTQEPDGLQSMGSQRVGQKVKRNSKSSMKVKVESEKVGLKLNIQKTKIRASGPTTSWEIDGETVETDFIFLGS